MSWGAAQSRRAEGLLALAPGEGVAAFGDVVESGQRRREVSHGGKFAVGIADAQNSQHRPADDDHPVHIAPGALDADVVQRREALASEEVDFGEVKDQLLGDAGVMVHEAAESMTVGGVDVTSDADEHAPVGQLLRCEDRSAGLLHLVDGWQRHVMQLNRADSCQGELLPRHTVGEPSELGGPCSLKAGYAALRIARRNRL